MNKLKRWVKAFVEKSRQDEDIRFLIFAAAFMFLMSIPYP